MVAHTRDEAAVMTARESSPPNKAMDQTPRRAALASLAALVIAER